MMHLKLWFVKCGFAFILTQLTTLLCGQGEAFEFLWNTTLGTPLVELPLIATTDTIDIMLIDWGDGSPVDTAESPFYHTYQGGGTYKISITGGLSGVDFSWVSQDYETEPEVANIRNGVVAILAWGDIEWEVFNFFQCTNMAGVAVDTPNLSSVTNLSSAFSGTKFNGAVRGWNVSNVIDMRSMFRNNPIFNQDMSDWDTGNVKYMDRMFLFASGFNQNIGMWNTENVISMSDMFRSAMKFNQDLHSWNVHNVETMNQMFMNAHEFNGRVDTWVLDTVDLTFMFLNAYVFNQDVSGWDISNVTSIRSIFSGAHAFNQDVSSWDVSNISDFTGVFASAFSFDQNLNDWDMSNAVYLTGMFSSAKAFNTDISSWDVSSVVDMSQMFAGTDSFNQDITLWDISSVTDMSGMFRSAASFNQDISIWSVGNVENFKEMFRNANAFNADITGWDISHATDLSGMFWQNTTFNQDIGNWATDSVVDMSRMFSEATSFNHNIGNWNTSKVTDMSDMFNGASEFDQLLSQWDVSQVGNMEDMFTEANLSPRNYDKILNSWGGQSLQQGVSFSAGMTTYCEGAFGRLIMTDVYNWNISDGGEDCTKIDFVTVWNTTEPGTTDNDEVRIPTRSGYTYDFDVDWGDGTTSTNVTASITHTFATGPGLYEVRITGQFPTIYFNNGGDRLKLERIDQWGSISWETFQESFEGCENLIVNADDSPDLNNVTNMSGMFRLCTNFGSSSPPIDHWYLGNVTNISSMFYGCSAFNQDISAWYTGNITNMSSLFRDATNFNQDIGNWDVSSVNTMSNMFRNATVFNQDISSWDVSSVGSISSMFWDASSFNQDIGKWDVSGVTSMNSTFREASSFDQNLGSWDIGNATGGLIASFFNTNLSVENYDSILIGWSRLDNLPQNINTSFLPAQYCLGSRARDTLITNHGWTISDNGQAIDCPCPGYTIFKDGTWDAGTPAANTTTYIETDYDSDLYGEFDACNLIIGPDAILTVRAGDTVNILTSLEVHGDIVVEPTGFIELNN